jgi:hypothetical protein
MSRYSDFFLVSSPDYCELTEKMRIRSYGCWLTEEAWLREAQSKKQARFTLALIRIARKIAKERGVTEDEAFAMFEAQGNDRGEFFAGYEEEIDAAMTQALTNKERSEEMVTLFMKNRGEVLEGKKWQPTDQWTVDDTCKLPTALMRKIEEFMKEEDDRPSVEQDDEDEDSPK